MFYHCEVDIWFYQHELDSLKIAWKFYTRMTVQVARRKKVLSWWLIESEKRFYFFNPNVTGLCAFLSSHNFNLKFKEKTQQLPSLFGCFLNFSSIHASGPRSDCFVNRAKKKVLSHLKETGKEWRSEPASIKNIVSEMEHCCRLDTVLCEASIKIPFE